MRETTVSRWISGALILSCALLSAGCSTIAEWAAREEWRAPRVVQVKGIEELCTYPPSWCVKARTGRLVGILARDGDLFMPLVGKERVFLYRETDGKSLVLEAKEDLLLLNGKAVSVQLSEKGWQWLRNASIEDLAGLRFLEINGNTETLDFPVLEKLARVRPDIGLILVDRVEPDVAARVVALFEPHFLVTRLDALSARFDALAPRLGKLEILWTDGEGPLDFLPRLPRLRTLLLNEWKPGKSGGIPGGSRTLRSLTIMGSKERDLSFLRNVTGLRELVLWEFNELKDITALAALPELKKLVFGWKASKNVLDLAVLERLPELAWVGFPPNTSQEAFARVIASHSRLQVVELRSEGVRDLSPLRSLRHLKAAILLQENADVGLLQDLKRLRYLGLHKEAFAGEAAKKTEALENALPDTFVAQAGPFCLGSGWILLLLPALVLLRSLRSRWQGPRSVAHA